jgi:hypothetical protein
LGVSILASAATLPPAHHRSDKTALGPSFDELLARPVALKPELKGQHPRIFFTSKSLDTLRRRAKTADREMWQASLKNLRALKEEPPPPGSPMLNRSGVEQEEGDLSQYDIAYALSEATFAYAIERDPKYLDAAKRWLLTIVKYDPWGYTFRTPNVDLPPAHFLYSVAFAYDTLYNDLSPDERTAVRAKLVRQARFMYDFFKYKAKKRYSFSQNHTFIPMTGLGIAAFALLDEEPEAENWAKLSRAVFDRVLDTFNTDGYYYEGFHYCVFSVHWIIRYLDALDHSTGEDLYPRMQSKFQPLKYYIAHEVLPNGRDIFDLGDAGKGATDRNLLKRETLNTGYEVLYRFAGKYQDAQAQGIADWLRRDLKTKTWEPGWALYSHDPGVASAPMTTVPASYYFPDADTLFWRTDWTPAATAIAFRCGPPEGHHVTDLLARVPEWRLNTGHAHPDANSFIIFSNGHYLTGDTGYTGVKMTKDHNTLLVDGKGQENEGRHEVFANVPYERLNQIRISKQWSSPNVLFARGDATAAYFSDLGLKKVTRDFLFVSPAYFVVWDNVSASEPRTVSWLLNSDRELKQINAQQFIAQNGDAGLQVSRLMPATIDAEIRPLIVTSQGRPGEVENGNKEQRGLQLEEKTGSQSAAEFLHVLQLGDGPAVLATTSVFDQGRGARLTWADGSVEVVRLKGESATDSTDGYPSVVRIGPNGEWQRLVLIDGKSFTSSGKTLLSSDGPICASLVRGTTGRVTGTIEPASKAKVLIALAKRPGSVRVNGKKVQFDYNALTRLARIDLSKSTNTIDIY